MSHRQSKHPQPETLHHVAEPDRAAEHSNGETSHHERADHAAHHKPEKARPHRSPHHPHDQG